MQRKVWCRATQGRPIRSAIPVSEGEIAAEANPLITGEVVGDGCVALHGDFGGRDVGLLFGQNPVFAFGYYRCSLVGKRSSSIFRGEGSAQS